MSRSALHPAIHSPVQNPGEDAYAYLWAHATRQNTIPSDIAFFSFTLFERDVLALLRHNSYVLSSPESESVERQPDARFLIVYHKNHRLGVRPGGPSDWNAQTDRYSIQVSPAHWDAIMALQHAAAARLALRHVTEVDPFLESVEQSGASCSLFDEIEHNLRHLAPLIGYIGDDLYSAEGYWSNNLLPGDKSRSILQRLRNAPLADWSRADRCFVFAVHCLLLSGGAYRLEGMNGMQLDPITVESYLTHKAHTYSSIVVDPGPDDLHRLDMLDKARRVGQLEARLRNQYVLYRAINGTTLNKQLRCFPRSQVTPERLPDKLCRELRDQFGLADTGARGWQESLTDVAVRALSEQRVHDLLLAFIRSGLHETESDFFMSRGPRFLYIPENYQSLRRQDFYCAVLSRPGFEPSAYQLEGSVGDIRWHQSCRMQFNSWKFWYGSLSQAERSPSQYWFIPPGMPDIAYHEDMVHAGHKKNGVVQSVRSPGALYLRSHRHGEPRHFLGACDTRACRSDLSRLFGAREMVATITHQVWITHILQVIADRAWEQGVPLYIDSFDREFHDRDVPRACQ